MSAAGFYCVFIRDGVAKVFHEDDFDDMQRFRDVGWEQVFDSARSYDDGYAYAARMFDCINLDYNDKFGPVPMEAPTKLYRSVSIRELVDLAHQGVLTGRGTSIVSEDPREFVFFCDEVTPMLANLGEELERQAQVALEEEGIHFDYATVCSSMESWGHRFVDLFKVLAKEQVEAGGLDVTVTDAEFDAVRNGDVAKARQLARYIHVYNKDLNDCVIALSTCDERRSELESRFNDMKKEWIDAELVRRQNYPFTSAIIETKPIKHGYHYSEKHGRSAMGEMDEYGFVSNSVSLDQIQRVHCFKDGKLIRKVEPADLRMLAEEIEFLLEAEPNIQPGMSA